MNACVDRVKGFTHWPYRYLLYPQKSNVLQDLASILLLLSSVVSLPDAFKIDQMTFDSQ